jgi:peptide/nickel transport system substrate-binding protein
MECPDENTFVFHAKNVEPMLVEPFIAIQIVPKKYMQKVGDEGFQKAPVGTGPWKYVKFVSGERMEMVANEDYWGGAPYFEKLTFLEVPEESTQIAMLKRGEIDRTSDVSLDRASQMRKEGWRLLPAVTPTVGNIMIAGTWDTDAPTKDIRVRQAMSYALNREEWANSMFLGFAEPGGRFSAYPGTWGWDPNWGTDPYDPKKAQALLKEAGYPQKFQDPVIKVYATTRGITPDFMQVLAGYWEAVGIQTRVIPMENAEFGQYFFRRSNPKNKEVIFGAVLPFVYFAAPNNVYHAANCFNTKGMHPVGYDPKCDELYGKLMKELDPKKAIQYYRDWMNYSESLYIYIPTLMIYQQYILSPKIGEITQSAPTSFKLLAHMKHAK